MATVAGLGIGLIILAVVWVLCIFTCIALTRAQGAIAYSGVAAVLVALLLTIILWFFPRGPESATQDYIIYDGYFIPRTILVTVAGFMLLVGGVLYVLFHVFDPQVATPLRKMKAY